MLGFARDITERKRAEQELQERAKELACLYAVSPDMREDLSIDELCRRAVEHLTPATQFPEIPVPVIELNGKRLTSENYTEGLAHGLHAEIRVEGEAHGHLWVYYAEEKPFLIPEEQNLVSGVAEALSMWLERKWAEGEIEGRRRYLEGVPGAAPDAIVTLDARHRIVEWNLGAQRLFGYSREEVIGQNIHDLVTGPDVVEEAVGFTQTVMGGGEITPAETVRYRKDGSTVDVIVAGSPILVGDEFVGAVAVYTDISERKRTEEELAYMATHDALTGLPNRWLFNDRLTLELARAQRNRQKLAVMLLDLDHFKDVNDTLGHAMGDKLLQVVGNRLASLVRKSDTVARMGGDEFMLLSLFPGITTEEDVAKIARRILEAFRTSFVLDDHELHITISIGISIHPDDGEGADTLMKNADIAMYRAKAQGRDNYQRYSVKEGSDGRETAPFGKRFAKT